MPTKPIEWHATYLRLLDQTKLPSEIVYLNLNEYDEVADAIKEMRVRGAPAIGVAAAYGLALGAQSINSKSREEFMAQLHTMSKELASTRPTAVNLFWALDRMNRVAQSLSDIPQIKTALIEEAQKIEDENDQADRRIGEYGAGLIEPGFTILTHCNAGGLATTGYGTALGVIKSAHEQGKEINVFADETRPLLQGARLTAWELVQSQIPVTLITDNMAGHFMHQGKINCVVVGADRITANGDVANKIGTYGAAVLAKENSIPFYVAAPTSTIDLSLKSGDEIPIEERKADEVTQIGQTRLAPVGVRVANPAFDVTPHRYVSAIITEKGIVREPYQESINHLFQ